MPAPCRVEPGSGECARHHVSRLTSPAPTARSQRERRGRPPPTAIGGRQAARDSGASYAGRRRPYTALAILPPVSPVCTSRHAPSTVRFPPPVALLHPFRQPAWPGPRERERRPPGHGSQPSSMRLSPRRRRDTSPHLLPASALPAVCPPHTRPPADPPPTHGGGSPPMDSPWREAARVCGQASDPAPPDGSTDAHCVHCPGVVGACLCAHGCDRGAAARCTPRSPSPSPLPPPPPPPPPPEPPSPSPSPSPPPSPPPPAPSTPTPSSSSVTSSETDTDSSLG